MLVVEGGWRSECGGVVVALKGTFKGGHHLTFQLAMDRGDGV